MTSQRRGARINRASTEAAVQSGIRTPSIQSKIAQSRIETSEAIGKTKPALLGRERFNNPGRSIAHFGSDARGERVQIRYLRPR